MRKSPVCPLVKQPQAGGVGQNEAACFNPHTSRRGNLVKERLTRDPDLYQILTSNQWHALEPAIYVTSSSESHFGYVSRKSERKNTSALAVENLNPNIDICHRIKRFVVKPQSRSEERRVGKECVRTCRSRGAQKN